MLQNSEDIYLKAVTYHIAIQLDEIAYELISLRGGEEGNLKLLDILQRFDRVYDEARNAICEHLAEDGFQINEL